MKIGPRNHFCLGSVRRAPFLLNRAWPRRRGRPPAELRRHLSPVRRVWPRLSASVACMTSTATPRASGRVHFALPRPLLPEPRPQRALRRELTPASSCALLSASPSTKLHPKLRREPLSKLHPLTRRETHRWADIPFFPQIGPSWPSSPANSMPSAVRLLIIFG